MVRDVSSLDQNRNIAKMYSKFIIVYPYHDINLIQAKYLKWFLIKASKTVTKVFAWWL